MMLPLFSELSSSTIFHPLPFYPVPPPLPHPYHPNALCTYHRACIRFITALLSNDVFQVHILISEKFSASTNLSAHSVRRTRMSMINFCQASVTALVFCSSLPPCLSFHRLYNFFLCMVSSEATVCNFLPPISSRPRKHPPQCLPSMLIVSLLFPCARNCSPCC